MSKIEDALKKAYETGVVKYPGISVSNADGENTRYQSLSRGLVAINSKDDAIVNKKVSIKEIALMKNTSLLDASQLADMKVINTDMIEEKTANSYRDLRTKLLEKTQGRNAIVLVTSCMSGDESSLATINIATAFSFDESKSSLVIDCNFHNPQIEKILNIKSNSGLIDYLESEDILEEQIIHETGIKRLRMIPVGKVREIETEYFTSFRMKGLMKGLLSRYPDRHIFINSRPIDNSADTRILSKMCDYVLMVVPYGKATSHKIKEAVGEIEPSKFMGVVFVDKPKLPKKDLFSNWFKLKLPIKDLFLNWFKNKLSLRELSKAAATRTRDVRPTVINLVDNPHGGGVGHTSGGRHQVTPWRVRTRGHKTRKNKHSDRMFARRRNRK